MYKYNHILFYNQLIKMPQWVVLNVNKIFVIQNNFDFQRKISYKVVCKN